jgi:hypothetical protein
MIRVLLLILLCSNLYSQGLIVNEISNGISGTKEFIELLVVGSVSQPSGLVDISGWVIDDNNGDFETLSGAGVAAGHYRFVSYPPVKIGSLIVIYNQSDRNTNVPLDDELDSNNDFVYVLPINSVYLERCTSLPSSTTGSSYTPCTYSSLITQTWNSIGLRNGGDAVQVRKPDYSFYHGFSYGDVLNPYPSFPIEFGGGSSFNIRTGSGTTRNYFLDCGDWTLQTNYQRGDANFDTPGLPNTTNNSILVDRIRASIFNYSNLSDVVNCQDIILDGNKLDLRADKITGGVFLHWNYLSSIKYEMQRSTNGYDFNTISYVDSSYYDYDIYGNTYYRLKLTSENVTYSNIVFVEYDYNLNIYPNPFNNIIHIKYKHKINYILYDIYGKVIISGDSHNIPTDDLNQGAYILNLQIEDYNIFKKVYKY